MSNLTHLFKVNQAVKVNLDGKIYKGTVTKTYEDHIIINAPEISNHLYYDADMLDTVYPEYNF